MGIFQKIFKANKAGGKMSDLVGAIIADVKPDETQLAAMKEIFQAFKDQKKYIKEQGGDKQQIRHAREEMTNNILGILNDQQKHIFSGNMPKYEGILHQR
ncbi:hypothetical protein BH11BAC6_BH11BAC6_16570 [soil metagenome]